MSEVAKIQVRGVRCSFKHANGQIIEALRDVDLDVPDGQFLCIVGRSGGGKSTLVRAIAGLTPLTAGAIFVGADSVRGPSASRGMVFQEDTVFPWMRVLDNVEYGLKSQGKKAADLRPRAMEWLKSVGLERFASTWPKELSGGMRKRVALATVFAAGAEVLIMDEPFGALDYVTRMALHDVLLELWQGTKRTVVFVTHDIEEALVLGDRILVIGHGRVLDDIVVDLARPRREEERASAGAVAIAKTIVGHLRAEAPGSEEVMPT